jgi:hypothetical protein
MSAELKAGVLAAAAAEPSPTRAAVHRRNRRIGGLAIASGLGAFVVFTLLASRGRPLLGGEEVAWHAHVERSVGLVVSTAGGASGVAATALWFALRRGRSMLGRSRTRLLCGITLTPLALFAWKVGCGLAFGDAMVGWPTRPGLRCLSLSLLVAVGPLLAFLTARRTAPAHPALNGAAMGVASGACAWVALDLWCPVAFVPHLVLGHVLPLCILAATGALLGWALLSVRSRPRG